MYDLNITIVNWKMREDIDRCLASLFPDLEAGGLTAAVQVVDNSSNCDGIKGLLESQYPQVRYLDGQGNIGFGRAQNLGLRSESARFYLPLNPDIEFFSGRSVLRELVDWLDKNPQVGMIGPQLLNPDNSIQDSCCRFSGFLDPILRRLELNKRYDWAKKRVDYYLMRDFDHKRTVPVDWLMGSFILARKEVVADIGFFDHRFFMYFEDCDWCRRAWRAGWQVYYYSQASVKHSHRRESANTPSWKAVLTNPVTRMHIKSWLKYFWKWKFKRQHYGI